MSQNNSKKDRKSKFSNGSHSTSQDPSNSSNPSYPSSFKPQAPSAQAPHYYMNPVFPPGSHNTAMNFQEPIPTNDKGFPMDTTNLANYANSLGYMAFFPQAQPPPQGTRMPEVQQPPQYTNFYNMGNVNNMGQGYPYPPAYQPPMPDQGFPQKDNGSMGNYSGQMIEERGNKAEVRYFSINYASKDNLGNGGSG